VFGVECIFRANSGSSDDGSGGDQASGHEENSPKVDITE
jgi:hypothetical protein